MTTTPSQGIELPATRQLVDGEWSDAPIDLPTELENPNTGEVVARMKATSDEDVERVAAAAARVHDTGAWLNVPAEERAAILDTQRLRVRPQRRCRDLAQAQIDQVIGEHPAHQIL